MSEHKHLEDVEPGTLSPEEIKERLDWRDEHPAEVTRYEREREAQRRLDAQMQNARDGFLLAGGTEEEWKRQEKQIRSELISDEAKAASAVAHNAAARTMWRNF